MPSKPHLRPSVPFISASRPQFSSPTPKIAPFNPQSHFFYPKIPALSPPNPIHTHLPLLFEPQGRNSPHLPPKSHILTPKSHIYPLQTPFTPIFPFYLSFKAAILLTHTPKSRILTPKPHTRAPKPHIYASLLTHTPKSHLYAPKSSVSSPKLHTQASQKASPSRARSPFSSFLPPLTGTGRGPVPLAGRPGWFGGSRRGGGDERGLSGRVGHDAGGASARSVRPRRRPLNDCGRGRGGAAARSHCACAKPPRRAQRTAAHAQPRPPTPHLPSFRPHCACAELNHASSRDPPHPAWRCHGAPRRAG